MEIKTKVGLLGNLPMRKHKTDGGADLFAGVIEKVNGQPFSGGTAVIAPMGSAIVNCCISMAIPRGYIGDIRPRSGLFFKHGIFCAGTIDSDYRGEIKVCLRNLSNEEFPLSIGERIAQLCIVPVELCGFKTVLELPETERGDRGFGSTGMK